MMITHSPVHSQAEATQRATYAALMGALETPARIYDLPRGDAFDLIADAVLHRGNSWYTPNQRLAQRLLETGARPQTPDSATYHFYTGVLNLNAIAQAYVGEVHAPDSSATLVIACDFHLGEAPTQLWTGAGIKGVYHLALALPDEFWAVREQSRYPLGWNVFFTDGRRVIGLPRTTRVTSIRYDD